jgi:hypothetical protein
VKEEKITWNKIYVFLTIGFILFFLNWWLLVLPLPLAANTALYIFTMTAGYLSLLAAGVWISRLLKNNLMDDVFNLENESFAQETRLIENEYSVNLRSRFYYKKKWNDGWIKRCSNFSCVHRCWKSGQWEVFLCRKSIYQTANRKGLRNVSV